MQGSMLYIKTKQRLNLCNLRVLNPPPPAAGIKGEGCCTIHIKETGYRSEESSGRG